MAEDHIQEAMRRALRSLRPPIRLPLSEWIEASIVIPEDVSATPGRARLWPYQREIADSITDPEIERVTIVKSARLGFTTLLTSAIGSFVANEPAPILALLPTEADCRDYIVSDIEPIFDASPKLRGLLTADAEEGGRNTLLHRRFPGGSLKVVAAKAPRNLRRHNVRVLFIDEADAMEPGAEGSPIILAEKRTMSFPDRKIVIGSTPLIAETSNVLRAYASSDQRIYECPCPSCGAFNFIQWRHIEWPDGQPEKAAYRCPHCEEIIPERHKMAMVAKARWRAQRPEVKGHAGFWINALVSPLANASWGMLAQEFLRAKDDSDMLQPFVNTVLAEGWREAEDEVDDLQIQERLEPFGLNTVDEKSGEQRLIPDEVLALTSGTDVQDDRLEVTITGWSPVECFVLDHIVIWGSPADETTWAEHDELLRTQWKRPDGRLLRIASAAVDSGDGDWTDQVYSYCFPRLSRGVKAIKGVGGTRPAIQMSKSKVKGGRLFLVGVDGIKTTLMSRLARGRSIRFSDQLEPVYFEQLASEKKVVRYVRGQPIRRFERKVGAKAEALDCLVYAYAARQTITLNAGPIPDAPPSSVKQSSAPGSTWVPRREGWFR